MDTLIAVLTYLLTYFRRTILWLCLWWVADLWPRNATRVIDMVLGQWAGQRPNGFTTLSSPHWRAAVW